MANNLGRIRLHSNDVWYFLICLHLFSGNVLHEALLLVYDAHTLCLLSSRIVSSWSRQPSFYVLSGPQHFSVTIGVDGD
jgi:hypothetical protein